MSDGRQRVRPLWRTARGGTVLFEESRRNFWTEIGKFTQRTAWSTYQLEMG